MDWCTIKYKSQNIKHKEQCMSFAAEVKNELARVEPEKKCCMLAEIAGFLRVAGSIGLAGGGHRHNYR